MTGSLCFLASSRFAALAAAAFGGAGAGVAFYDGEVAVGQTASAIGYPLHIGKSLSAGLVSGTGRVFARTTSGWLSPFLRTDAAISPGNSGGPLVDSCGWVIGRVSAGLKASGAEGIGLVIPVSVLRPIIAEIIATGAPRPDRLAADSSDARRAGGGMGRNAGFLVATGEPGSAAERAGLAGLRGGTFPVRWGGMEVLLGGDIITEVNGERIETHDQALDFIRRLRPGDHVDLVHLRDGERMEASVDVEERRVQDGNLDIYRLPGEE